MLAGEIGWKDCCAAAGRGPWARSGILGPARQARQRRRGQPIERAFCTISTTADAAAVLQPKAGFGNLLQAGRRSEAASLRTTSRSRTLMPPIGTLATRRASAGRVGCSG